MSRVARRPVHSEVHCKRRTVRLRAWGLALTAAAFYVERTWADSLLDGVGAVKWIAGLVGVVMPPILGVNDKSAAKLEEAEKAARAARAARAAAESSDSSESSESSTGEEEG